MRGISVPLLVAPCTGLLEFSGGTAIDSGNIRYPGLEVVTIRQPERSSVDELAKTNPGLEKDTIRGHLAVLKDVGAVEELTMPAGKRTRGYPYKFYRLTERARDLFDATGLFPEEAWKRQYDRLAKDAEMRELERMPRPEPEQRTTDDDRGDELAAD